MGMREAFQAAAKSAARAAGNVFEEVGYRAHVTTTYDASTDTASVTSGRYMVSMMFDVYSVYERQNQAVEARDIKGLLPRLNLPTRPSNKDLVTRMIAGVSAEFEVVGYQTDPAEALWELQLRQR